MKHRRWTYFAYWAVELNLKLYFWYYFERENFVKRKIARTKNDEKANSFICVRDEKVAKTKTDML